MPADGLCPLVHKDCSVCKSLSRAWAHMEPACSVWVCILQRPTLIYVPLLYLSVTDVQLARLVCCPLACVFWWVNHNNGWVTVILLFRWIMGVVQKFRCSAREKKWIHGTHDAFFKVYLLVDLICNTHNMRHDTTAKKVSLHMYIIFNWELVSSNVNI